VPADAGWAVKASGAARFSWEYDDGRDQLLRLYQKGKDKQWDAATRIDWSLEVDPSNPLELPDETVPIYGSELWERLDRATRDEVRRHMASWQFSQFLHGEQGAAICSARTVECVPDLDAKFYAATQTMDEARHAEIYSRFLHDKVGMLYPINGDLQSLLGQTLSDSRWDMPYLGMQVLVEGLALAAFGLLRDVTQAPLPKQILTYVMQDEARHVAFGRLALRDYYRGLTDRERDEREEFVVEGCYLMRDRFRAQEVWENMGFDVATCNAHVDQAPYMQLFRQLLFSRIVPCMRDIGLFGERVRRAYEDLGVLDLAGADLDALMRDDEEMAEALDRQRDEQEVRELAVREAEIEATIAEGRAQ
jgi:hypothetical protein